MSSRSVDRDRLSFGLVASAALVAIIVVAGLVVFFTRGQHHSAPAAANNPPADTGNIISDATGFGEPQVDVLGRRVDIPNNPAGQPLPQDPSLQHKPSDKDWLTAAPAGTTGPDGWQRVFGVSVPFSTSDGPTTLSDGLALGFAHTPQGAALAAAQISYRLNARPGDRQLVQRQVLQNPAQLESYDEAVAHGKIPVQQPERVTKYLVAPDAFQLENYADDMAIVRLAVRGEPVNGQPTWAAVRLIVVWDAGDWRLQSSTTGVAQTEYITSLVGWTQW